MDIVWTDERCLGLGALAALGWLIAEATDILTQTLPPTLPPLPLGVRLVVRAVLVLSFPVLIFALDRSARAWLGQHQWLAFAIVLPAVVLAALAALLSPGSPADELLSFLLVPTASLGLALGVTDSVHGLIRPQSGEGGYSPGVVTGFGFWLIVLLGCSIFFFVEHATASCVGARFACGGLASVVSVSTCAIALGSGLASLIAGSLGYAIGRRLPRLARKASALSTR